MSVVLGLAERIRQHADRDGERPFIVWGGQTLTYGEADVVIRRVGAALSDICAERGGSSRVVIYAENCPAAILTWLGAQAAGLTPVTLNRAQRGKVLADIVTRSAPAVVVTDAAGEAEIAAVPAVTDVPRYVISNSGVRDFGALEARMTAPLEAPVPVASGDTATIMFSSGTTGTSKGVVIPHGVFDAGPRRLRDAWQVTEDDVFHCWVPWFHIAAQLDVFALAIHSGASVALFPGFSLSQFWKQIHDSGATIFGGFVSVLELLYNRAAGELDTGHRLRFGIAGHIPATLRRKFEQRFAVRMVDAYGMSEAEPLTIPGLDEQVPDGSCGRANPDFDIQIQDSAGRPCAPGVEGQIVFRPLTSDVMMTGYLDDPERTRAAWRGGWFLTGDLGTMDASGRIYFRERMADFIRVRGENVAPQEVESVLIDHPAVAEVGVVGVESPLGEHDVKAVIVRRAGADVSGLPGWCDEHMAKFMVPAYYEFVDELPRTPTSKIQRSALRAVRGELHTRSSLSAH